MRDGTKKWRPLDWIVFFVRLLLYISALAYYWVDIPLDLSLYVIVFLFLLSYVIPHLFWRPGYTNVRMYSISEIIFSGGLSLYQTQMAPTTFLMVSSFMIGYLANVQTLKWSAPIFLLLLPVLEGFIMESFVHSLIHSVTYIATFGIGYCLHVVDSSSQHMKKLLNENEEKSRVIEEQNKTLIQYSEQIEQLTLAEERSRMARELHDTVGHTFTSSIVGIEASSYLIDQHPEKAKEKLMKIHTLLSHELEGVRRNIHAMAANEEIVSLSEQFEQVIYRFEDLTSSKVELDIRGKEQQVSGEIKMTLIRCLQEALTNGKRHGQASEFQVTLTFDTYQTVLSISDNGRGSEHITLGFGLSSMEERLLALQGSLTIDSEPGEGTVITCIIPLGGEANERNSIVTSG